MAAVGPGWPDPLELAEGRHGRFLVPRHDKYVGRSLRLYGEWCAAEWRLLSQILRTGDVVVDGGANLGAHAVPMARAVGPEGRVWAVEAQPGLAQTLSATAALNGLSQLRVVNAGLSDVAGWLDVPLVDYGRDANYGGLSLATLGGPVGGEDQPRRTHSQRLPLLPLDDLLALPKLRLIKLDLEGMEAAALRGARRTLARARPLIYAECDQPEAAETLLPLLAELGYDGWWHAAPLFEADNWRCEVENVFGRASCVNLLAAPKGSQIDGLIAADGVAGHPRLRAGMRASNTSSSTPAGADP